MSEVTRKDIELILDRLFNVCYGFKNELTVTEVVGALDITKHTIINDSVIEATKETENDDS